ncbi:restriction endonuclease subunit S [Bradyrhizobium sp. SK17]|uniref:restriction endonuclease subunit S n=1 Tax=Bradyrhizobium sp. SK17 TaxID=2057741 RepID=UPI000C315153|nr:restriction endonuclease subunit S [Bradyrhizobium sp. SK17]AUC93705.1 restriction endonuclease subunit S [Bradyrhizobium sp. SK17]
MNGTCLLAHYEKIADAPDAIAKLRRFILDLAVRGKLVPQDATDEPASELLKRIGNGKSSLIEEGKLNRQGLLPNVDLDHAPFDLPAKWAWGRFPELGTFGRGKSKHRPRNDPALFDGGKHLMIQTGDVARSQGNIQTYTSKYNDFGLSQSFKWPRGTLCITIAANIADSGILGFDACFPDSVVGFIPAPALENARYFEYFVRTAKKNLLEFAPATAQKNINLEILTQVLIPLPPLAEQRRIVAKVDELMLLCDRLEAARENRERMRDRLTAASLVRLNAPEADVRFAINALPALTVRPDQIRQLRHSIFNLAVRGRLVPQDANEEPASELLKRILKETPTSQSENPKAETPPYDPPRGWLWTHLGRLVGHSDAGWSPKTLDHPRNGDEWGVLKVSAVSWDRFRSWENKQVLPGTEPRFQAEVKQGDFLISRANTAELIARAVLVNEQPSKLMMSDKIVRLRLSANCNHRFVWIVNNYADFAREHYVRHASGVSPSMKNVSRDVILSLPFPLPPLAEQHRIVSKVEALIALCDRLETNLTTIAATRGRLLDALLAQALTPADSHEREAAE